MANLQVKEISDELYNSLRVLAKKEKRSISQEVVLILEEYLSRPLVFDQNPTDQLMKIAGSWEDDRSADEIVSDSREARKNSRRFEAGNELSD